MLFGGDLQILCAIVLFRSSRWLPFPEISWVKAQESAQRVSSSPQKNRVIATHLVLEGVKPPFRLDGSDPRSAAFDPVHRRFHVYGHCRSPHLISRF